MNGKKVILSEGLSCYCFFVFLDTILLIDVRFFFHFEKNFSTAFWHEVKPLPLL